MILLHSELLSCSLLTFKAAPGSAHRNGTLAGDGVNFFDQLIDIEFFHHGGSAAPGGNSGETVEDFLAEPLARDIIEPFEADIPRWLAIGVTDDDLQWAVDFVLD